MLTPNEAYMGKECLVVCLCVYVAHLKRETEPNELLMWKYTINAGSRIIDGSLLDQPDREHGNPLKPDRTRDHAGKKLGQSDPRRISANP